MLFTGNPADRMAQMAETAAIIAEPVRARHTVTISGRQHVRVEGWTMLGALLGVHPYLVWSRPVERRRRPASAGKPESKPAPAPAKSSAPPKPCASTPEKTWAGRDDYALRSMAQTRATSKAMRQPLGFIITLAGFDATPAEEMPSADRLQSPEPRSGGLPITEPQQKKIYLLRDKLTKAGVFTIEEFDDPHCNALRYQSVSTSSTGNKHGNSSTGSRP